MLLKNQSKIATASIYIYLSRKRTSPRFLPLHIQQLMDPPHLLSTSPDYMQQLVLSFVFLNHIVDHAFLSNRQGCYHEDIGGLRHHLLDQLPFHLECHVFLSFMVDLRGYQYTSVEGGWTMKANMILSYEFPREFLLFLTNSIRAGERVVASSCLPNIILSKLTYSSSLRGEKSTPKFWTVTTSKRKYLRTW